MSNSRSPRAVRSMTIGISGMPSAYANHRGALETARAQVAKRLLGLLQLVDRDTGPDRHLGRDRQQLLAVLAGQVGDRSELALLVEKLVGKGWDVGHVDAGTDDHPIGCEHAQCLGHE